MDFLQTYPLYFYVLAAVTIVYIPFVAAVLLHFQFFVTCPDLFSEIHMIIAAFPNPVITWQMPELSMCLWPASVSMLPAQENNTGEHVALPFLQWKHLFGPLVAQNLARVNMCDHFSTLI